MKNKELLCKLENQLDKLKKAYSKYLEIDFLFDIDKKNEMVNQINKEIARINDLYELVQKCEQEGIELGNNYYLVSQKELNGIYFSIQYSEIRNELYGFFYIEDDDWLYDNFYSSHSELNIMINNLIVSNLAFNNDYGNYIKNCLSSIKKFSTIKYMYDLLTTSSWERDYLVLTVQNTLNMLKNHYQDEEEVCVDVSSRSSMKIIEVPNENKEKIEENLKDKMIKMKSNNNFVYIVFSGCVGDVGVDAVFKTEDAAKQYIKINADLYEPFYGEYEILEVCHPKEEKYLTFNVGFINPETQKEDETQFDVYDFSEISELFTHFAKENHWYNIPEIIYVKQVNE